MARETRRGPVAVPGPSLSTTATGRDYRAQVGQEKRRRKHERELAKKKKDSAGSSYDERVSRSKSMVIEKLYPPDCSVKIQLPSPFPIKNRGSIYPSH
jgi:hypothetical protein